MPPRPPMLRTGTGKTAKHAKTARKVATARDAKTAKHATMTPAAARAQLASFIAKYHPDVAADGRRRSPR
jgi:hypothetical protein